MLIFHLGFQRDYTSMPFTKQHNSHTGHISFCSVREPKPKHKAVLWCCHIACTLVWKKQDSYVKAAVNSPLRLRPPFSSYGCNCQENPYLGSKPLPRGLKTCMTTCFKRLSQCDLLFLFACFIKQSFSVATFAKRQQLQTVQI